MPATTAPLDVEQLYPAVRELSGPGSGPPSASAVGEWNIDTWTSTASRAISELSAVPEASQ